MSLRMYSRHRRRGAHAGSGGDHLAARECLIKEEEDGEVATIGSGLLRLSP